MFKRNLIIILFALTIFCLKLGILSGLFVTICMFIGAVCLTYIVYTLYRLIMTKLKLKDVIIFRVRK